MAELTRHATSLFLKGKGLVGITEARVRNSTRDGKESEQGVRDCGCLGFLGQAWSMHGDEASSLDGLIIVRLGCHQC